jgi:hypothetical protein
MNNAHNQITTTYYLIEHQLQVDRDAQKNPMRVSAKHSPPMPLQSASDPSVYPTPVRHDEKGNSQGDKHCIVC